MWEGGYLAQVWWHGLPQWFFILLGTVPIFTSGAIAYFISQRFHSFYFYYPISIPLMIACWLFLPFSALSWYIVAVMILWPLFPIINFFAKKG